MNSPFPARNKAFSHVSGEQVLLTPVLTLYGRAYALCLVCVAVTPGPFTLVLLCSLGTNDRPYQVNLARKQDRERGFGAAI